MSYKKLVHELLEGSDIELATYSNDQVEKVKLTDVENTVIQLGAWILASDSLYGYCGWCEHAF